MCMASTLTCSTSLTSMGCPPKTTHTFSMVSLVQPCILLPPCIPGSKGLSVRQVTHAATSSSTFSLPTPPSKKPTLRCFRCAVLSDPDVRTLHHTWDLHAALPLLCHNVEWNLKAMQLACAPLTTAGSSPALLPIFLPVKIPSKALLRLRAQDSGLATADKH